MLHYVSGDLLLSRARALAHGVAPDDHFDTSLALQLREQWPALAKDFRHYCHGHHPKPGELWVWPAANGVRIISLLTQEPAPSHNQKPDKATLANVGHALHALRRLIEKENLESVALSRLATGVGGLAWEDVKPLIEKHLGDVKIPVYVYETYRAGQRAHEPGIG
jgi:O-acetyl-ADP-ribose deacetylase (regulator of RNase III)